MNKAKTKMDHTIINLTLLLKQGFQGHDILHHPYKYWQYYWAQCNTTSFIGWLRDRNIIK